MKLKTSQKGLTFVQISIFLSIFSIILCIALPIYLKMSCEAKYHLCESRLKNIKDGLDKYYKKDSKLTYPDELQYEDLIKTKEIKEESVCPITKTPYKYEPIWDSSHQQIENFIIYCDSPNAHSFIGKKGYPKYNSQGEITPESEKEKNKIDGYEK